MAFRRVCTHLRLSLRPARKLLAVCGPCARSPAGPSILSRSRSRAGRAPCLGSLIPVPVHSARLTFALRAVARAGSGRGAVYCRARLSCGRPISCPSGVGRALFRLMPRPYGRGWMQGRGGFSCSRPSLPLLPGLLLCGVPAPSTVDVGRSVASSAVLYLKPWLFNRLWRLRQSAQSGGSVRRDGTEAGD